MSNIHNIFKCEDVNGQVIGGSYSVGQVFYNDRHQGQQLYAVTEELLIEKANALISQYKKEDREFDLRLFQDDSLWTLKIFN